MKTITVDAFSPESIDKAIAELEAYKKSLKNKCIKLIELMCREGEQYAKNWFAGHLWTGATQETIMGYREGDIGLVVAGGAAAWIEFGTGTQAGQWPYPGDGKPAGWDHGSFGEGHGNDPNGWTYWDEAFGQYIHTKGHITDPFMWDTAQTLKDELHNYAKKIFNG